MKIKNYFIFLISFFLVACNNSTNTDDITVTLSVSHTGTLSSDASEITYNDSRGVGQTISPLTNWDTTFTVKSPYNLSLTANGTLSSGSINIKATASGNGNSFSRTESHSYNGGNGGSSSFTLTITKVF